MTRIHTTPAAAAAAAATTTTTTTTTTTRGTLYAIRIVSPPVFYAPSIQSPQHNSAVSFRVSHIVSPLVQSFVVFDAK